MYPDLSKKVRAQRSTVFAYLQITLKRSRSFFQQFYNMLSTTSTLRLTSRLPRLTTSLKPSPIRIANFSSTQIKMSVQAIESYEDFQRIINGDKIAAIDFWATWCGPCKMISPLFEKFASEAPADQIAFYKVDVDEQEKISQEVGITAMPTFVFFKNGQKITQTVGANPQQLQVSIIELTR